MTPLAPPWLVQRDTGSPIGEAAQFVARYRIPAMASGAALGGYVGYRVGGPIAAVLLGAVTTTAIGMLSMALPAGESP